MRPVATGTAMAGKKVQPASAALYRLMTWLSPAYPVGAFSYSGGIEAAVEDVLAIADAAALEKFVLVGHGFGAAVAGAFSTYYPERLAGLLYVEAPGDLRGVARNADRQSAAAKPITTTIRARPGPSKRLVRSETRKANG